MTKIISIIIPFYNEKENIVSILSDIKKKLFNSTKYNFEIILMDNHSNDGSDEIAKNEMKNFDSIKYFRLSRNFGYQSNIKAGLEKCSGDAAVQLDADGEDDPILILDFIKQWENGYDVVYGIRKNRKENFFLSFLRNKFYSFLNKFSDINLPNGAGDFRLIDRKVIDYLKVFDEKNLYLRGLISFIGFKQTGIQYDRLSRKHGKSKISILKYFDIAMSAITSFTRFPLLLIFFLGVIFFSISIVLSLIYLLLFLFGIIQEPGFTTIILIQLFFFGLIMFIVGIISLYVGYILDEVKNRPNYIIEDEKEK